MPFSRKNVDRDSLRSAVKKSAPPFVETRKSLVRLLSSVKTMARPSHFVCAVFARLLLAFFVIWAPRVRVHSVSRLKQLTGSPNQKRATYRWQVSVSMTSWQCRFLVENLGFRRRASERKRNAHLACRRRVKKRRKKRRFHVFHILGESFRLLMKTRAIINSSAEARPRNRQECANSRKHNT